MSGQRGMQKNRQRQSLGGSPTGGNDHKPSGSFNRGWQRWAIPKEHRWPVATGILGIIATLAVGYIAVIDKPFASNNVAFAAVQIAATDQPPARVTPTVQGITNLTLRLAILNQGNRQIAVHRISPAIQDSHNLAVFHKLIDGKDWIARNPRALIDGGKVEMLDLPIRVSAGQVSDWAFTTSSDDRQIFDANQKVKTVLCLSTIASNAVPRKFLEGIAWMFFKDGNYVGTDLLVDVRPVEQGEEAPTCVDT